MQHLRAGLAELPGQDFGDYRIENCDDFSYTDPVDHSVSEQQGIRLLFANGSRIVYTQNRRYFSQECTNTALTKA